MWLARVRIRVRCRSTCSFVRVPFGCFLFVFVYVGCALSPRAWVTPFRARFPACHGIMGVTAA